LLLSDFDYEAAGRACPPIAVITGRGRSWVMLLLSEAAGGVG
jgi:hypothetical protein